MGYTSKTQESNDVFDEDLFGSDDEDRSDENNITSRRSRVNRSLDTSSSDDSDNETPIEQSGLSAHEQRDGGEQNTKLQKLYTKTALSRTKTNKQTTTRTLPSTKTKPDIHTRQHTEKKNRKKSIQKKKKCHFLVFDLPSNPHLYRFIPIQIYTPIYTNK
jgi:hypothetical protein